MDELADLGVSERARRLLPAGSATLSEALAAVLVSEALSGNRYAWNEVHVANCRQLKVSVSGLD